MSEPTIEDVVGQDYWCRLYGSRQHSQVVLSCVDAAQTAILAVLRELEGCGSVWVAPDGTKTFGTYDPYLLKKFLDRIRAALGDEK